MFIKFNMIFFIKNEIDECPPPKGFALFRETYKEENYKEN